MRDRVRNGLEQVSGSAGAVRSRFCSVAGTTRTAIVGSSLALVVLAGIGTQALLVGAPGTPDPQADGGMVASPVAEVSPEVRAALAAVTHQAWTTAATLAAAHPAAPAAAAAPLLLPGPTGTLGVPVVAIKAYQAAAASLAVTQPDCRLSWTLVAGIGRIESGHARGGLVDATGRTGTAILGPALDGTAGNAAIPDTDGGRLDGDTTWDRAVGPMQFIPTTWARWGADANGDGVADPSNINDAALATGRYLCASGGDLSTPAGASAAVLSYNHSASYVTEVLAWAAAYATGVVPQQVAPVPPETTTAAPAPSTTASAPAPAAPTSSAPSAPRPTRTTTPTPSSSTGVSPSPTAAPTTTSAPPTAAPTTAGSPTTTTASPAPGA